MTEKTCERCGNQFDWQKEGIAEISPMCRSCLEDELEKFPILPPRVRYRAKTK